MPQFLLAVLDKAAAESEVSQLITVLIILLLVATAVALLSRRFQLPYITGLVLAGLAIAAFLPRKIGLDSSLVLNLFLPILLFEAAVNTDISRLRSTLKPISLLAGPGVVVASGITALILKVGLGLPWIQAMMLGVILSITDTVSVIAVFKEAPVPSRLSTIVEGESLFNDGLSLVLFTLILKIQTTGTVTFQDGLQELLVIMVGGGLLGLAVGYLSSELLARSDDPLGSILLTVAIALGTFEIGELLHVSGVISVVIAGLIVGNIGLSSGFSASSRITLLSFWEYAGFGVNTFIFLLIGLEIKPLSLLQSFPAVLLAVVAYQTGRALCVYPLLSTLRWFDRPIPFRWQHVLFFGNIKGSLSMALALGLPSALAGRGDLIAIVFGTVLLSVIIQGVSLPWIVKRLNISHASASIQQIEELQAQLIAGKAAQDELASLLKTGILPKSIYEEMRAGYQVRVAASERTLRDLFNQRGVKAGVEASDHTKLDPIRRRLLLVEKGALNDALRKRILSEEVVRDRLQSIDAQLLKLEDD